MWNKRCIVAGCTSEKEELEFQKFRCHVKRVGNGICPIHNQDSSLCRCSAKSAKDRYGYFKFPQCPNLQNVWRSLLRLPADFHPSSLTYVCSKHFPAGTSRQRKIPVIDIGQDEAEIKKIMAGYVSSVIQHQQLKRLEPAFAKLADSGATSGDIALENGELIPSHSSNNSEQFPNESASDSISSSDDDSSDEYLPPGISVLAVDVGPPRNVSVKFQPTPAAKNNLDAKTSKKYSLRNRRSQTICNVCGFNTATSRVPIFEIPSDPYRQRTWAISLGLLPEERGGNGILPRKTLEFVFPATFRICGRHFPPSRFTGSDRASLTEFAVPVLLQENEWNLMFELPQNRKSELQQSIEGKEKIESPSSANSSPAPLQSGHGFSRINSESDDLEMLPTLDAHSIAGTTEPMEAYCATDDITAAITIKHEPVDDFIDTQAVDGDNDPELLLSSIDTQENPATSRNSSSDISITEFCRRIITDNHQVGKNIRCNICHNTLKLWTRFGVCTAGVLSHCSSHIYLPLYRCRYCEFRSSTSHSVLTHVKNIHPVATGSSLHFIDMSEQHRGAVLEMVGSCFGKGDSWRCMLQNFIVDNKAHSNQHDFLSVSDQSEAADISLLIKQCVKEVITVAPIPAESSASDGTRISGSFSSAAQEILSTPAPAKNQSISAITPHLLCLHLSTAYGFDDHLQCRLCNVSVDLYLNHRRGTFFSQYAIDHALFHLGKPVFACWRCKVQTVTHQAMTVHVQNCFRIYSGGCYNKFTDHSSKYQDEILAMLRRCYDYSDRLKIHASAVDASPGSTSNNISEIGVYSCGEIESEEANGQYSGNGQASNGNIGMVPSQSIDTTSNAGAYLEPVQLELDSAPKFQPAAVSSKGKARILHIAPRFEYTAVVKYRILSGGSFKCSKCSMRSKNKRLVMKHVKLIHSK